jgi:ribosomal protein S18 acetylase RimI-like enzyme
MATITVREFAPEDAADVSRIMIAAFRSFLNERFDEMRELHYAPELVAANSKAKDPFRELISFVALDGERIVGYVKVSASTGGLGNLSTIGVDPECFAKGVGAALMKAAEKFWYDHGQRKIATCVSAHNKRALMYYLKHDFVPEGYQRDHFMEGVDEIILGRFLKKQ